MQLIYLPEVFRKKQVMGIRNSLSLILILIQGYTFAQNSETRSLRPFSGIQVGEGIDVVLKKGPKEQAVLEVDGVALVDVVTEVSGDFLKIHLRGNHSREVEVKILVTYVKVDKLSASSGASITSPETLKANALNISSSSASFIELRLETNTVEVSASSAGDVELSGKVKRADIDVSSAGEVDAFDLACEEMKVTANSAGSAKVNVEKALEAQANSGGSIRYKGNPEKSITDSSSGGSVKKSG
jgi:Putative auto-transporter adhesin, head GIN domain